MNPEGLEFDIMDPMSASLGITIVRMDQSDPVPSGIYGAFKILLIQGRTGGQYPNREMVDNADPAEVSERFWRDQEAVVSLVLYGTEDGVNDVLNDLYQYAESALDFLALYGREAFQSAGLTVDVSASIIDDTTTYNGSAYEYRLGFQFKVRAIKEAIKVFDAIDMDATFDEITEEIIYGE